MCPHQRVFQITFDSKKGKHGCPKVFVNSVLKNLMKKSTVPVNWGKFLLKILECIRSFSIWNKFLLKPSTENNLSVKKTGKK